MNTIRETINKMWNENKNKALKSVFRLLLNYMYQTANGALYAICTKTTTIKIISIKIVSITFVAVCTH